MSNSPRQSRRDLASILGGVALAPLLLSLAPMARAQDRAADQDGQTISFEWELPRTLAPAAAQQLQLSPDSIRPAPGSEVDRVGPLIVVVVGAVLLITLAEAVLYIYRDLKYGGILIEDKGGQLVVKNDVRLPSKAIIIKDKAGVRIQELSGPVTLRDLTNSLSQLLTGGKPKAAK